MPAAKLLSRGDRKPAKLLFGISLAFPPILMAISIATGDSPSYWHWIGGAYWVGLFLAIISPYLGNSQDELRFWKALGAALAYALVCVLCPGAAFLLTGFGTR